MTDTEDKDNPNPTAALVELGAVVWEVEA